MAKNVLQKRWNGTDYDEIHPITTATNVITSDGSSVEGRLADVDELADDMDNVKPRVNTLESVSANRDGYGVTAGTATAYTLTLAPVPALAAGLRITANLHANNGATPTINVNGLGARPIRKPNGTAPAAGLLKAGGIYTLVYDGTTAFILTGEGGEYGTAVAADVLAGKTIGTESGLVAGTMVDRGSPTITPGVANQSLQAGRYTGGVVQGDSDLVPANIRANVDLFGVTGTLVEGKRRYGGSVSVSAGATSITVPDLPFVPTRVIAKLMHAPGGGVNNIYSFVGGYNLLQNDGGSAASTQSLNKCRVYTSWNFNNNILSSASINSFNVDPVTINGNSFTVAQIPTRPESWMLYWEASE